MNIMWFDRLDKNSIPMAGGKGANLGEMTKANLPVPPGFVVTSEAYFKFVRANGLDKTIKQLTSNLDIEDSDKLSEVAEKMKKAMMTAPIPDEIRIDIVRSYNQLCDAFIPTPDQEKYVAVRSSATAEDLPEASFAGQQETYLNVKGADNVVEACRKCWASLFGARSIYYRQTQGFDHLKVGLAAVVQEMVQSEKAGVMFSVEPVSQDANMLSIEAAYGLGEVVVSGSVTPDRFLVNKKTLEIVEKDIAEQAWMLVRVGGENRKVDIREDAAKAQKLTDDEVKVLAQLGILIEQHYGKPQDMEWALQGGKFYIVQSRPITTLKADKSKAKMEVPQPKTQMKVEAKKEEKKMSQNTDLKILTKGFGASPGVATGKVVYIPTPKEINKVQKGDILVTDMTTPDFVPAMKKAIGIVTNSGGVTCHAAIVSRELGIPCIVGTRNATEVLKEGMIVTVDATHGVVYDGAVDLGEKQEAAEGGLSDNHIIKAESAPITGTKIYVNLAEPQLAHKVAQLPVDGVGLLRAEFMIADLGEHPRKLVDEGRQKEFIDKLAEGIRQIANEFYPRPVVYRATDFKTNEYRNLKGGEKYEPKEENPMIGYRGCARYIREPEVFHMEVEAIKKVREEYGMKNVWVMIPFVRRLGEMRNVLDIMREFGLHRTKDFKVWMMCEVPSTVFLIEEFCKQKLIDGVSIGSNDLTQLIMGIDRDSSTLARDFDERNAAVLTAIRHVAKITQKYGVTCSICGQAPSVYPEFAEKLVEFGMTSMSVNPDVVERTKKIVAAVEQKILLRRLQKLTEKDEEDHYLPIERI